jgi:hypothetical protein
LACDEKLVGFFRQEHRGLVVRDYIERIPPAWESGPSVGWNTIKGTSTVVSFSLGGHICGQ